MQGGEAMGSSETPQDSLPLTAPDQPLALNVYFIPRILYCEMSARLTMGPEKMISLNPLDVFMVRSLDPNHKETGFEGCIGIRELRDLSELVLWPHFPEAWDRKTVLEPPNAFRIVAKPGKSWWIINTEFDDVLAVDSPMLGLIELMMKRRDQLRLDPNSIPQAFWDRKKH